MNYTRTLPLAMALVVALAACGKQEAGAHMVTRFGPMEGTITRAELVALAR